MSSRDEAQRKYHREYQRKWINKNREYSTWSHMIRRCYDIRLAQFKDWGGRGITVCDEWRGENGYEQFLKDMGKRPTPKHSIERRDNFGSYSPDNCYWATRIEQGRNKRNNVYFAHQRRSLTIADWSRELNIEVHTLRRRLVDLKWTVEECVTMKPGAVYKRKGQDRAERYIEFNGENLTISQWSQRLGITAKTIYQRLRAGWPPEKILIARNLRSEACAARNRLMHTPQI